MTKKKPSKPRNWDAVNAHFRSSAGPMKAHSDKHEAREFKQRIREELADAELDQLTPDEMKELERNREDPKEYEGVDEWQDTESVEVPWWNNVE